MNTETTSGRHPSGIQRLLSATGSGKNRIFAMLGVFAAMALLGLGIPFYLHLVSHESTDDAYVEAQVVSISPQVSGHIVRVLAADNQEVAAGDLLAEVDPRDYKVALDIALARMQSAQAARAEAEAQVSAARKIMTQKGASLSSQHAELAQARAGVAEYKAGHDRDESDLKRLEKIVEAGAVSRQEYDHARTQAEMSRAKLTSVKRQVETQAAKITQAQAVVGAAGDELRQALALVDIRTAELREAQAMVEQARLNLSYTRITAPCAGHVTKKAVEPGAYVQVGQKLFSIVGPEVWVVANFKETQIAAMRPGLPVDIEVDAYPGVTFQGRVDSLQRGTGSRFTLLPPENATGNFIKVVQRVPVKIVLNTPQDQAHMLAPGMSAVPSVDISASGDTDAFRAETGHKQGTTVQ